MKLSIITINYNNCDGLQKTIESIVSQSYNDFEWIVIDGGSTDGSRELIEQYASRMAYWVSEPDKGIYNAMNKGIVKAKGEYTLFLNSGDWLVDKTSLERCFSHNITADVVYGDVYLSDENGLTERRYPDFLSMRFFFEGTICHNAAFIRRILFSGSLYNEQLKIVSDYEFFLIQALKNRSFEHIDEFVISYDMYGISSSNWELMVQERELLKAELFPKLMLHDFRKMDEMEATLDEDRVKKVLVYSKNKWYRKMITGLFKFIGLLDCHFGKKHYTVN